jgi:hypothetical protein
MYRFRNIEYLLDKYNELENQEIYFATQDELNDPMEGFRDIFWKGDEIVWKNFIINYVMSAEHIYKLYSVLNESKRIDETDLLDSYQFVKQKLNPQNRAITNEILQNLFAYNFIKSLPIDLSKRINPIKRNELLHYLQFIHPYVINSINKVYNKNGTFWTLFMDIDIDSFDTITQRVTSIPELMNKIEKENGNNPVENLLTIFGLYGQMNLLQVKKHFDTQDINVNRLFLMNEFPIQYLKKINAELYPPWFSASFLTNYKNSAIWGHYGNNHKGVCLKFKPTKNDDDLTLNLETEYGYSSGPVIGMRPHVLRKVEYRNKHTEIDFFRSIGRLTKDELNLLWYRAENGALSDCGKHLLENEDEWRENYWNNFYNSLSIKLKEWEYEGEYRLVIHGDLIDYKDKNKRKLKYDFNDLEGIIFGISTSVYDKLRIIKIIDKKCNLYKRERFDFYQAYYSTVKGQLEIFKMPESTKATANEPSADNARVSGNQTRT